MTKEEFEQGYAERSGITVEELHELGQYAKACDCDEKGCLGWKMEQTITITHHSEPGYLTFASEDCVICGGKHYGVCPQVCKSCGKRFEIGERLSPVVWGLKSNVLAIEFVHVDCS